MIRHLFTAASAISLVVCIVTVVLWVRSETRWEFIVVGAGPRTYTALSRNGEVDLIVVRYARAASAMGTQVRSFPIFRDYGVIGFTEISFGNPALQADYVDPSRPFNAHSGGGFFNGFAANPPRPDYFQSCLRFPHWALAMVCSLLPAYVVTRRLLAARQGRRNAQSVLCPRCGYDLRASTSRCPECGTPISVKVNAS